MTHLNELSKVYNESIAEAMTPEQRKAAQEILDKETGADKKKAVAAAKKERSEIRKEKELELKAANLEIRKKREARREAGAEERAKDKAEKEKRDTLKAKQKDLAAKVKEKRSEAGALKKSAKRSERPKLDQISDKEGEGTALGKFGSNVVKAGAGTVSGVVKRVQAMRKSRQASAAQKKLDATKETKNEEFLFEVGDEESSKDKSKKIVDVMKGKNKIEVNPQVKAEGVIDAVKAGAKRHSKAIEKKKIKNRKAVPYAALAAEHQPEGEVVSELKNSTLLSYSQKATNDLAFSGDGKKKAQKRAKGIKAATGKLAIRATDPDGSLGFNKNVRNEDYHSGQGEKIQKRTLKWMRKKGMKGAPGLDAMKEREAEHKAKRGVKEEVGCETKKVENKGKKKIDPKKNPVVEAKVDKGRSDYGKASIRNYRRSGPGHGEPAMFDPENKRGKLIDKRREEHKARRGVKGAKVPAYKVKEDVTLQDANGKDRVEIIDIIKPEPMKSPKNNIMWNEEKMNKVIDSVKEKKRKNALQINKIVGTQ